MHWGEGIRGVGGKEIRRMRCNSRVGLGRIKEWIQCISRDSILRQDIRDDEMKFDSTV